MPRHNRDCPICSTTYSVTDAELRMDRHTTCSRKCSYELRGRNQRNRVQLACPVCDEQFEVKPYRVRKSRLGAVCCSVACAGLFKRGLVLPGMSLQGATAVRRGIVGISPSELFIKEELEKRAVNFIHQYIVQSTQRAFVVDFFFPDQNVVVEIDRPERHNRARNQPRDVAVDKLLEKRGVVVHRITDDGDVEEMMKHIGAILGL